VDADHYDEFADAYEATNASSLLNAHYERPAMIALVGDARGRRILDAGCGSGALSAALRAEGAVVTGVDGSPAMLELARTRLGDGVPLRVVDLAGPLPFEDDTFDDVVASLVLHYLGDWPAVLAEMRRVLRPGGRLIVSVNHRSCGRSRTRTRTTSPSGSIPMTSSSTVSRQFSRSGIARCTR
jgi:ubiquinone/menaquinone biosynthesis C-methylase UbiE